MWLSVKDYAKKIGKSIPTVYLQIRLGQVVSRKVKKEVEVIQVEFAENSENTIE